MNIRTFMKSIGIGTQTHNVPHTAKICYDDDNDVVWLLSNYDCI